MATSQGYFPTWQLPKCAISQAITSKVCPSRSARPPACYSRGAQPFSSSLSQRSAPLQHAAPQSA